MIRNTTLALVLACLGGTAMAAEDTGWYFGVTGGVSKFDADKDELDEEVAFAFESNGFAILDGDSTLDDKGTAWSAFGGYRFLRYFAAEVGYVNLGSARYEAEGIVDDGEDIMPASADAKVSVKGPTAALVGILPLADKLELRARAGALFADTKLKVGVEVDGFGASERLSASSTDLFYGLGLAWNVTQQWALNLDLVRYHDVGSENRTGESHVDGVNLAFVFRK